MPQPAAPKACSKASFLRRKVGKGFVFRHLMSLTAHKDRQNMWDGAHALYHMLCKVHVLADVCDSHAKNRETNEPTTNNTHTHTHNLYSVWAGA